MMRTVLTAALCSAVWASSSAFRASVESDCHDVSPSYNDLNEYGNPDCWEKDVAQEDLHKGANGRYRCKGCKNILTKCIGTEDLKRYSIYADADGGGRSNDPLKAQVEGMLQLPDSQRKGYFVYHYGSGYGHYEDEPDNFILEPRYIAECQKHCKKDYCIGNNNIELCQQTWHKERCGQTCSKFFGGEGMYFDAAAGMCREKMCARLDVSENCRGATGCTSTTTSSSSICETECDELKVDIGVGATAGAASGALDAEAKHTECLNKCESQITVSSFESGDGTCTATKVTRETALNGIIYECDAAGAIEDTFTEAGICRAHTRLIEKYPGITVCDNSDKVSLMGGKSGYDWKWQCGESFVKEKKDNGPVIGGSVGGVIGGLIVLGLVYVFCKPKPAPPAPQPVPHGNVEQQLAK